MNLISSPLLLLFVLISWLESSQFSVSAAASTTTSSTFYCGQTPCKPPGHCCGDYKASCCTSTSSGSNWYIFLIVGLVVVGVGVGVGVGIYFWRKRGGSLPYVRST